MKLNAKNLPVLIRLFFICVVVTTIGWELVERLLLLAGVILDLSIGPVGFDIHVIAVWIQMNPGTLLGIIPSVVLFKRL